MNIQELDSYNLADAVKFHNRLNPGIWAPNEQMRPEVRAKLLEIAADFQEFLGISDLDVEDITVSGSNAAYSYTPHSDIDLHLVVNQPDDEVFQELFNAKKYQYNDMHNIRIRGADVELYVQPSDQKHVSLGIYSVLHDKWIDVPKRKRARIDHDVVRHKYEDLVARINNALADGSIKRIEILIEKIKEMRQTGLDAHGEFGPENLAFKMLRTQGYIKQLWDAKAAAKDRELSLKEREKPHQRVRYGFGEDNTGMAQGSSIGDAGAQSTWDGVSPDTQEFLNETDTTETIIQEFIRDVADKLGIKRMPKIVLHSGPEWSESAHSFGRYEPDTHTLHVSLPNRHLLDVLRTTAHELTHCRQNEISKLPDHAGATGSKWENQAHAQAGIFMRDFADAHPEYFNNEPIAEASGYIPTKKQAKDPRFSTALTVDIHPGQTGKEANKMALKTNKQGKPALLMKTANLQESQLEERLRDALAKLDKEQREEDSDDIDGYEPPGPEFPPQMPAGTTKIDVRDLTDWYQLGMDISDIDDADPKDYNQGPPQTVIVFPSDEIEQPYLKQFKRLGLKTHDMDPDVKGGEDVTGKHLKGQ